MIRILLITLVATLVAILCIRYSNIIPVFLISTSDSIFTARLKCLWYAETEESSNSSEHHRVRFIDGSYILFVRIGKNQYAYLSENSGGATVLHLNK